MRLFKLHEGVAIAERREDIFVGHLDRHVLFTDKSCKSIVRELVTWSDFSRIQQNTSASNSEIQKVLSILDTGGLLSHREMKTPHTKITISNFNEIGQLLTSYLLEMGCAVTTSDEGLVRMSDVHGQLIKLEHVGVSYREVIAMQRREIINSGNHQGHDSMSVTTHDESHDSQRHEESLMIITAYPEPELLARLMESGTQYLCIMLTPSGVMVGPWVKPGFSPCFHCIELHHSDQDDQWQSVAATLFGQRHQRLAPGRALIAAALIMEMDIFWKESEITHQNLVETSHFSFSARSVQPAFSPFSPFSPSASGSQLRAPHCEIATRSWPFHPECSCHWARARSTRAS